MKKLTAGIFTVLLGVVAAGSADAALTSKKYVDDLVGTKVSTADFTQFKTDNTAAIEAAKKAGTDASAALETYKTSNDAEVAKKANAADVTAELAKKQNKLTAGTGIKIEGDTIQTDGIATSDALTTLEGKVTANTGDITTLKGEGEGSVKKSIADAIAAEVTRSDGAYDAKGAAGTAETNAKAYADGLAKNYATAAQGKTADDTAAAVNNATTGLAATKAIADQNKADIAAMDTAYKAADTAINTKIGTVAEGKTVVQMIEDAKTAATYDDAAVKADIQKNAAAITTINDSDVMKSGITATKVTTYDGYAAKIETAQTQADKGVEDAAAAQATANAAIPKPTADCTTLDAKCVLTVGNGGVYTWESVERATGETTGA